MNTNTMQNESDEISGEATYCPEDNKLRLYVGRVPREEYLALKKEGWTSTPKQDCDFAATWTPQREDTALRYAGMIGDEDQDPGERAAERAERFGGYLDKRLSEAHGHADNYASGPAVHGYQNQRKAERAASRHDRQGTYAVNAWEKAEYWQRRTAGVIANALYKDRPGVRMGRIKTLEAEQRRIVAQYTPQDETRPIMEDRDGNRVEHCLVGLGRDRRYVPVSQLERSAEIYRRYANHLKLRLAYENQMLKGQGGTMETATAIEVGGKIGGKLIWKTNKSPATGRIVSVSLLGPKVNGWAYRVRNIPGTELAEYQFPTERLESSAYTPPTEQSIAELETLKKQVAKVRKERNTKAPSLINPTNEDAERLQAIWNAKAREYDGFDPCRAKAHAENIQDQTVIYTTQEGYAARSRGTYGIWKTVLVNQGGERHYRNIYGKTNGTPVCKVREGYSVGGYTGNARRVIVLTDKPQKPLPASVWETPAPKEEPKLQHNQATVTA